jgi:hypothetical protein
VKANHIAAAPAGRPHIADLVRAMTRKLSDRVHATADDRARALGWEVTETSGWPGLSGRRYRDPRFGARADQQRQPGAGSGAGSTGRGVSIPRQDPADAIAEPANMPRRASSQAEPEAGV